MNRTKYVLSALCILVLMCLMPFEAFAQSNTIKGTVSSIDGPVIGATVKVKGSSNTGSTVRSQTSSMPTIPSFSINCPDTGRNREFPQCRDDFFLRNHD